MKLGRLSPTAEQRLRAPLLHKYLTKPLPPAPKSADFTQGVSYGLFGNDQYGDCTCAAMANYFLTCAKQEGSNLTFSDADVENFYFAMSGGKDSGLVEVDVLNRVRDFGFPLSGANKLAAWARVNVKNQDDIRSLISIFWCLYAGVDLPLAAQNQAVWTEGPNLLGNFAPGSWGGHATLIPKFDADSSFTCITWGGKKQMTPGWWRDYGDELYVPLDADRAKKAGVDWDGLIADMQTAQERAI